MKHIASLLTVHHLYTTAEYHKALLESKPSAMEFIMRFMQSDEPSFVHIALWIMSQFSNGGKASCMLCLKLSKLVFLSLSPPPPPPPHTHTLSLTLPITPDTKTKATLRQSTLLNKVDMLRSSRNSIEVSQLAETTLNNLKVLQYNTITPSIIIQCHYVCVFAGCFNFSTRPELIVLN